MKLLNLASNNSFWRGKDMTTVRFAYYYKNECHYESLSESKKEWSGFMCLFKVKQSRKITV